MMKEVVRALDTELLAQIGLIAFVLAFILVVIRVVVMKKAERHEAKQIPLQDPEQLSDSSNHD